MPDREAAYSLLRAARRDAAALAAMINSQSVADEVFGFLVQQSLEKTLKAWISLLGMPYPFTHDLTTLLNILDAAGVDVDALVPLAIYNPFAVELRYDFLPDEEAPLDRHAACEHVRTLISDVEAIYEASAPRQGVQ